MLTINSNKQTDDAGIQTVAMVALQESGGDCSHHSNKVYMTLIDIISSGSRTSLDHKAHFSISYKLQQGSIFLDPAGARSD